MTTSAFSVIKSIDSRLKELRILIDATRNTKDTDPLHSTLCRSFSVLIAAHLEGYTKDILYAILNDYNDYGGGFANIPTVIQRSFCRKIAHFEGVSDKLIDKRVSALIDFFSKNSVPIDMVAFHGDESSNKNASPKTIDAMFGSIGAVRVLETIATSYFEDVFLGGVHRNYRIARELRSHRSILHRFPYAKPPVIFGILPIKDKITKKKHFGIPTSMKY